MNRKPINPIERFAGLTDEQLRASAIEVMQVQAGTPSTTFVVANASNVTLLAANPDRLSATVYNDADKKVYVKLGAGASAISFWKKLLPQQAESISGYTGQIDAIWEAGPTGNMRVTELEP